jgi:hypothetical protein
VAIPRAAAEEKVLDPEPKTDRHPKRSAIEPHHNCASIDHHSIHKTMAVQVQSAAIADRSWMPSFSREPYPFFQDVKHMRSLGLPEGFPDKIEAKMAWTGDAYQDHPERYGVQLSGADIVEIKDAVLRFKGRVAHATLHNHATDRQVSDRHDPGQALHGDISASTAGYETSHPRPRGP